MSTAETPETTCAHLVTSTVTELPASVDEVVLEIAQVRGETRILRAPLL